MSAAQAGIAKGGVKDMAHAQLVLGMAETGAKNPAASKAFKAAAADPKHKVAADLWDTYSRSH